LNRCGRLGRWRLFCPEHRKQPIVWVFVLVFTVVSGTASIIGFFSTSHHVGLSDNAKPVNQTAPRSAEQVFQNTPNVRITYLRFENTILLDQALHGFSFSPQDGFATKPFWLKNGVYKDISSILSSLAGPTARRAYDVFSIAAEDGQKPFWYVEAEDGKIITAAADAAQGERSLRQIYPAAFPKRGPHFIGPQKIDDLFAKVESDPYWQVDLTQEHTEAGPIPFDQYEIFGLPESRTVASFVTDPISLQVLNANPERKDIVFLTAHCIHGDYHGELWIREIKLLTMDIENTGDRPIGLSSLKEAITEGPTVFKARSLAENQQSLATSQIQEQSIPLESLRPGEHLIVPLRIELGFADQITGHRNWNFERYINEDVLPKKWWRNVTVPEISFEILRSTDSRGNPQIDLRHVPLLALESKPDLMTLITPTYVIGQSIDVRDVVFRTGNGALTPYHVRKFDPNNLVVRGAYEAGSCPILSWRSAKQKQWAKYGRVLVDAVTSRHKMTVSIPVDSTIDEFKLSEEENEITFLEKIQLSVTDQGGHTYFFMPEGDFLPRGPNGFITLARNSSVSFVFKIPESLGVLHDKKLHISGYYIPRSLIRK
jgi:hypothetical protein